jgi:hypothetical protein
MRGRVIESRLLLLKNTIEDSRFVEEVPGSIREPCDCVNCYEGKVVM